jgi:suppressor of ftsI/bilirubin oxidase
MLGVLDLPSSLAIVAKPVRYPLLPGRPATMLAYEVEHDGRTFLNPLLRARTGATASFEFWNALDEESIIHWHGFKVDSNNDGHPHYAVPGGATYDYRFTIPNRAATYWYHPHPHHLTGRQTYLGLAGFFLVEDEDEERLQQALDLQLGATDVPLLIQDRRFNGEGQPIYAPDEAERAHGFLGDTVLVNFTPGPYLEVATRLYRFRIVNGSNARSYRLAFRYGSEQLAYHVIGNDGGLLDRPRSVKDALLAPAERLDVLLDLRDARPGDAVMLASLPFDPMHLEAVGAPQNDDPHARHAPRDGGAVDLLRIDVTRNVRYEKRLPHELSRIARIDAAGARTRVLKLDRIRDTWRINGLAYDIKATPIVVKRRSVEIWEIRNATRGMPHPMHVHGFQFQLLERRGSPEQQRRNALNGEGLSASDLGWKDTVLVWPGETVRLAIDFSHSYPGDQVYMVHCHNLEHEDQGMMLNFRITA